MSRLPPLRLWRMSRARYECLVTSGVLGEDDRVELLDGLLVAREPQGSRHTVAVGLTRAALEHAFGRGYHVREEKPVALDDASEPEPDLAVVKGRLTDYSRAHPTNPVLVVEVADTSLAQDRVRKAALYARAGITEYWILNLLNDVLEVYREPRSVAGRTPAWKFGRVRLFGVNAAVTPLGAPRARVRVRALLP